MISSASRPGPPTNTPPRLPPDVPRRVLRYPPLLETQLLHASELARALDALLDGAEAARPAPASATAALHVWLLGRSEEVRALVADVVREWTSGRLDAVRASDAIADYLDGLHAAVGQWHTPSCCGVPESARSPRIVPRSMLSARPRWDSEADTITEAAPLPSERIPLATQGNAPALSSRPPHRPHPPRPHRSGA